MMNDAYENGVYSAEQLEELFKKAENIDKSRFAEMRTNILLVNGEHYSKKKYSSNSRVRSGKELREKQRLRLVKNHTRKICFDYANEILSGSPGVSIRPKNESELQDQKAAEMHHAVWRNAVHENNIAEKIDEWVDDFVSIGEIAAKIMFDPLSGKIKGYEQKVDANGEPMFNEDGEPEAGTPIFEGSFDFEPVYGFNLLRCPDSKNIQTSPYLIIQKMTALEDLQAQFPEQADKLKGSDDQTFLVFDLDKVSYGYTKDQVLLKEFYFRPSIKYPEGFYYFVANGIKLAEGPLPGGIFPIVWGYFDKAQTAPRGIAPVKTIRPFQTEINRAASKTAEHQITLGDDKLLLMNGTNLSQGTEVPGVRSLYYSGREPKILAGRDGSHFHNYEVATREELYGVMNIDTREEGKSSLDIYTQLFRAASQKKKYKRYIQRFERFLIRIAETYLAYAKLYLDEDKVISIVGRDERVNIKEFKNARDINYEIIVEAQSEDVETKLGSQLFINQILQYTGGKLDKEDIGRLMKVAPYGNKEEAFSDLTLKYDMATNMILALDRGEMPGIGAYDDNPYMLQRLASRMRKGDFRFLDDQIKALYSQVVGLYEDQEARKLEKLKHLESQLIPTDGTLVPCDLYVQSDPKDPSKTKRVRLPTKTLEWVIKVIEDQGHSLDSLERAGSAVMAELASKLGKGPNQPQVIPGGQANAGGGRI